MVDGCTDPIACNYNAAATVDDGSCTYPGCTSTTSDQYTGLAFPGFNGTTLGTCGCPGGRIGNDISMYLFGNTNHANGVCCKLDNDLWTHWDSYLI